VIHGTSGRMRTQTLDFAVCVKRDDHSMFVIEKPALRCS
jgi:hypothetical protein